ncbi:MAG: AAA family ATPase [Deltaproteobacteria bacterium]|nr:AAA family ATPase [Deltaproteobacteria bacterium]
MSDTVLKTSSGDYQIINKSESGKSGETCHVVDLADKQEVALTFLQQNPLDAKHRARLKHALTLWSEIDHPHIARIYHFGSTRDEKRFFFTSEICEGTEIIKACQNKPVDFFEEILVQILTALDCMHARGLFHFDIKPKKILIREDQHHPHVKLLAPQMEPRLKNLHKLPIENLPCMAPEAIKQSQDRGEQVDLYALGMLCLRILSGQWPFDPANRSKIIEWHLHQHGDRNVIGDRKDIPPYMTEFISTLLNKIPSKRFANARAALSFLSASHQHKYGATLQKFSLHTPPHGPLVGRDAVIQDILNTYQSVIQKKNIRHHTCGVFGAQGIGKTRILKELRTHLELDDVLIVDIQCDRASSTWKKIEDKTGRFFKHESDTLLNTAASVDNKLKLHRRCDHMIDISMQKPLCLILDDFHLADKDSADCIKHLGERLELAEDENLDARILIVLAVQEPASGLVKLDPLQPEDVLHYLNQIWGPDTAWEPLASLVHEYSQGIPLVMREGLKLLAPHIPKDTNQIQRTDLKKFLPPSNIKSIYKSRVDSLDRTQKDLLNIISLIFRSVAERELCEILRADTENILASLKQLRDLGLITKTHENHYRAASQTLALEINNSLTGRHKKKLHEKIATGLGHSPKISFEELGFHFVRAGLKEQAQRACIRASQGLEESGDFYSAARCLTRLLSFYNKNTKTFVTLALKAATLLIHLGNLKEAQALLKQSREIKSSSYFETLGLFYYKQQKLPMAREAFEKALEASSQDHARNTGLRNAIANIDLQSGHYRQARLIFEKTLTKETTTEADKTNISAELSANNLCLALCHEGLYDEALKRLKKQTKDSDQTQITKTIAAHGTRGYVLLRAGRLTEAIATLTQAFHFAEEKKIYHLMIPILGHLITAHTKKCEYATSLNLLKKLAGYQARYGNKKTLSQNLLMLANTAQQLGLNDETLKYLRSGHKLASDIADEGLSGWFDLSVGCMWRNLEDDDKALSGFKSALRRAEKNNLSDLAAWSLLNLADLKLERREYAEASHLFNEIAPPSDDDEFKSAYDLLREELNEVPDIDRNESALIPPCPGDLELVERAEKTGQREFLWQVYHFMARKAVKEGDQDKAGAYFTKADCIINTIASSLPDEYQQTYRGQSKIKRFLEECADFNQQSASPTAGQPEPSVSPPSPPQGADTPPLSLSRSLINTQDPQKLLGLIIDKTLDLENSCKSIKNELGLMINNSSQTGQTKAPSAQDGFAFNPKKTLQDYEKEILIRTLKHFNGNKSSTAKALGISRLTLYKKIEEYKLLT